MLTRALVAQMASNTISLPLASLSLYKEGQKSGEKTPHILAWPGDACKMPLRIWLATSPTAPAL